MVRILAILWLSVVVSCTTSSTRQSSSHTSSNSVDWQGTYEGTLPCADCEGIKTSLRLSGDKTFIRTQTYLKDGKGTPFTDRGTFEFSDDGSTIVLKASEDGPTRYRVGENSVTQLDRSGKPITSELAVLYMLRKQAEAVTENALMDRRWELVELYGQPVRRATANAKPITLTLTSDGQRANAFVGCNTASGMFTVSADTRITFSQMAVTKMACPDMSVEDEVLKAITTSDTYAVRGDTLRMTKGRMGWTTMWIAR